MYESAGALQATKNTPSRLAKSVCYESRKRYGRIQLSDCLELEGCRCPMRADRYRWLWCAVDEWLAVDELTAMRTEYLRLRTAAP